MYPELNKYKTTIYLTKENEDFIINAKSLIGLLQGHFRENDIVKLMLFDTNYKEIGEIKELLAMFSKVNWKHAPNICWNI